MSIFTESFQYDILKMDNQPLLHRQTLFVPCSLYITAQAARYALFFQLFIGCL